jgi:hypothetical protein
MDLETRILHLEALQSHPTIPGTSIGRQFKPESEGGVQWCLALGPMCEAKKFYTGRTIEECVSKAELDVANECLAARKADVEITKESDHE